MPTTLDRILDIIREEYTKTATPESTLDSIGFDSLDIVEFGMYLEDEFGIHISDDELNGEISLAAVSSLVDSRKGGSHE